MRIVPVHAFLLAASVMISGTVVDASGHPVSNARVRLVASQPPSTVQTTTNSRGRFSIENVAPGTYRLRVDASGFRPASLSVRVDASPQDLRITLEPSALTLIGSVTGSARAPLNSSPLSQRVFPREAYRDQAQTALASVLDQTPGAATTHDPSVNASVPVAPALVSVRGGLPFETPTLLDGVTVSLPSSRTFDVSLIPTFVLGDVEVVKGPGDAAHSGGGVGGALNLRTAEPTATLRAVPEIEGDSQGGQFSDLGYGGTLPGGKLAFATMFSVDGAPGATSGYSYPVDGRCCFALAGNELRRSMLLDLRSTPSASLTLTGTMLAVNLDRALAATYGAQFPSGAVSLAPSLDAQENDRLRFELLHARYAAGDDAFDVRGYDLNLARDFGSSALGQSAYDSEYGADAAWTHAVAQNRYTLRVADTQGTARGGGFGQIAISDGSRASAFRVGTDATLAPSPHDRVEASVEMQRMDTWAAPNGAALVQRGWSPWNARLGYAHTISASIAVRASVGTSAVPPPLAALSGAIPAPQTYVGLPARVVSTVSTVEGLERASGVDVGAEWRLHGGTTTVSAGLYRSQTAGAYVLGTSPSTSGVAQAWFEGPTMIDDGVEVSIVQFKPVGLGYIAQLSLPRTFVRGPLDPSLYAGGGNLAILANQNVSGGAFFVAGQNDVAPIRVPYAQGYAELSYKWPRGSRASIGALYLGANNAYARDGFATLNANLEISVGDRGKLQFSVENLTGALDDRLPIGYGGVAVPLADGGVGRTNANVLAPRTLRFMYRQSFGTGRIFER